MAIVKISKELYYRKVESEIKYPIFYEVNNVLIDTLESANIQLKGGGREDPFNPNILIFDVDIEGYEKDDQVMFTFTAIPVVGVGSQVDTIKYEVHVEKVTPDIILSLREIKIQDIIYFKRKGKEGFAKILDMEVVDESQILHIQILRNHQLSQYEYLYVDSVEVEPILDRDVCGFREGDTVIFKNDLQLGLKTEPTFGFHKIEWINLGDDALKPRIKFKNLNQPLFFNKIEDFQNSMQVFQKIEDEFIS